MILCVYSIYDSKARVYSHPFFALNDEVAGRQFAHVANDPATVVYKNPGDFTLFRLGTFNDNDGTFFDEKQSSMGSAITYKEVANAP